VGRFQHVAKRLSIVGALALVVGSSLVAGVIAQAVTSAAYADTVPYETFCAGTPAGNIVLNDVVVTGALSPASPSAGQQFNVTGLQVQEQLPASVVQDAEATGLTSLTGTLSTTIDATGATPSSLSTGSMAFDIPLPNPVPSSGVALDVPSTPATVGPFTATSSNITVSEDPVSNTTDIDGDGIGEIDLNCSSYPNDTLPSGFSNNTPPGLPIATTIATAGNAVPPPAPSALTGPYELYCPHTPVGDLVLNGVTTTATISPATGLSAGQQFSVTGYQTNIPLPPGLVSAAAGLGNSAFNGLAASAVDAYGATTDQAGTGSMPFDVSIPATVPTGGLAVSFPTTPITVGPFTASGGPITVAQDQSTQVVAALSSKAFTMSCTAYANNSVPTSGSTGTAPSGPPIRPVIATASATGTMPTTTTTPPTTVPPTSPSGPYEMYCPGSPVGNLVLNDTTTSATIAPSALTQGQQFTLNDLQTQFSIPQSVVQEAENLGLTQISGSATMFLNSTGAVGSGFEIINPGGPPVYAVGSSGGASVALGETTATTSDVVTTVPSIGPISTEPYPYYPGGFSQVYDVPFSVVLPNPVPSTGVQFAATVPPGELGPFTATGGPISFDVNDVNLNVDEFGDHFGLFCDTFPNDSEPTGLATDPPSVDPIEPVIATGTATITPPPPIGPGGEGPYELYCPGSPIGNLVLNDVTTTATLSPPDPSPGQQFTVTNYQAEVPIPASIASAAAAVGNTALSGTAMATIDASGASPASIPTGPLTFDTPIPNPVPPTGVTLTLPLTPASIGPFTATSSSITIAQNADATLTLLDAGSNINLSCTAYPDDSAPSGIDPGLPDTSPISPVIVTAGVTTTPTTGPGGTVPPTQPGPYELYCPGTPVGNIVLNNVTTSGTISPATPSAGTQFDLTGYTSAVDLPTSIVSAAAALGNSAITGTAVTKVDATGATPASISSGELAINAPIPSPVPSSGLTLNLPASPATLGPFTATGGAITLTVDPAISLALDVSGSTLNLTCTPYSNNAAATGIVSEAPIGSPISPVIATVPGTGISVPPTTPTSPTSPTTSPTSPTTPTIPPAPGTDSGQITQAFQTLFDPSATVAEKVAVLENGASLETALSEALSSGLASNAGGASVDDITFQSDTECSQLGLTSPCAIATFDILGPDGTPILSNNRGYAVSVDGAWLVSTTTACDLLGLFYSAEGKTGSPPGCSSGSSSTTPTTIDPPAPTGTTDPSPAAAPGASTTPTAAPASTAPASTAPARSTAAAAGVVTAATDGSSDPGASDPPAGADPVVQADSGSLAFTGLGSIAQWLAVVGGALMLVGFVLLTMVDAPRRARHRLARMAALRR
jgi:hypothetical protein